MNTFLKKTLQVIPVLICGHLSVAFSSHTTEDIEGLSKSEVRIAMSSLQQSISEVRIAMSSLQQSIQQSMEQVEDYIKTNNSVFRSYLDINELDRELKKISKPIETYKSLFGDIAILNLCQINAREFSSVKSFTVGKIKFSLIEVLEQINHNNEKTYNTISITQKLFPRLVSNPSLKYIQEDTDVLLALSNIVITHETLQQFDTFQHTGKKHTLSMLLDRKKLELESLLTAATKIKEKIESLKENQLVLNQKREEKQQELKIALEKKKTMEDLFNKPVL